MLTDATTPDLPSTVDETLNRCPQFRIVLIGNSGVGKSSLVSAVFNISLNDIDIAHNRPGRAEISHGYTSDENQRFVLHDSKGYEAGSTDNWKTVEDFLRDRSAKELRDRVHAIWLCIEAPREGARLQQTGDEKLLALAKELHIPVVIVFTKYDNLINEQYMSAEENRVKLSETEAEKKAETCFKDRINELKASTQVSIVKVSTDKAYPQRLQTLHELTNATRKCLGDTELEEGALVQWITAQRISARQKVETSISEGSKKYWRNLGKSAFFQGHTMNQCVWRIHDDILKVWNFNDPRKLLFQEDFFKQMLQLVNPVLDGHEAEVPQESRDDGFAKGLDAFANVATSIGASSPQVALAAGIAGISILALKFLYGLYQKMPLTTGYLGAYIVDLTCILHRLFMETLRMEPPRTLSKELISSVVTSYKEIDCWRNHKLVFEMNFMHGFEEKIKDLILTTLPDTDALPQSIYIPLDAGPKAPSGSVPKPSKRSKRQQKSEKHQSVKQEDGDRCIVA